MRYGVDIPLPNHMSLVVADVEDGPVRQLRLSSTSITHLKSELERIINSVNKELEELAKLEA